MKISPDQLYDQLLAELENKRNQPNKTAMIENCFWAANTYWHELKALADKSYFECEGKEINFFRNIKPKFTSQIQFYSIIAEVVMFVPTEPDVQLEFWNDELNRAKRFFEKHKEFVTYYETKSVDMDSVYFKRVEPDWVPTQPMAFFDSDKRFCSSHDHLVRGILAHKMYHEYVLERLQELGYT